VNINIGAKKHMTLGIPKSAFHGYQKDTSAVSLNNSQSERLSSIDKIHPALRVVFSSPNNVYGFMGMINNTPYSNDSTPLSIISTGSFGALYAVFKRNGS
jgi:hypothetical protein